MSKQKLLSCSALIGAMLAAPTGAFAQQQAQQQAQLGSIEEIVVTSRRREENLQAVPLSIAAFSTQALEQRNVFRFDEMAAYVPNLIMTDSERVNISSIEIRGIGGGGPNTERSFGTGIYIDGMYISDSSGAYNSTFGVERIEVLRGPQGTLFGRNTTGGLINIVTQRPGPDPETRVNIEYGRFNLMKFSVAGNMTVLPEKLFARVGVNYESDDGFYTDTHTGEGYSDIENRTGRASLRWLPNDNWTVDFNGQYSWEPRHAIGGNCIYAGMTKNQGRANTGLAAQGLPTVEQYCRQSEAGIDDREFQANPAGRAWNETRFATFQPKWDSNGPVGMFDNLTVAMNLGYRYNNNNYYADNDYTTGRIAARSSGPNGRTSTSKSAELLFNAQTMDNRLDLTAGLYWYKDNRGFKGTDCGEVFLTQVQGTANTVLCPNPGGSVYFDDLATFTGIYTGNQQVVGIPNVGNTNKSAFASGTFSITEALKLEVGGRYSVEDKSIKSIDIYLTRTAAGYEAILRDNGLIVSNIVDAADTWKKFTPKASLSYTIEDAGSLDSANIYGVVAKGFLSGGFNNEGGPELLAAVPSFAPEDVISYEIGAKTNWLDNRARVNIAAFYTDYSSRQVEATINNSCEAPNAQYPQGGACGLYGTEEFPAVVLSLGNSKIKGLELETNLNPVDNLLVDFSASYIKSKNLAQDTSSVPAEIVPYLDLDTSTSISNAPRWRSSWGVSYTFDMPDGGTITPRINGNYVSAPKGTPDLELRPGGMCHVGAYTMWNGRVTWENPDRNVSVAGYATNLTNLTRYRRCSDGRDNTGAPTGFGTGFVSIMPPLVWGIQTSFKF